LNRKQFSIPMILNPIIPVSQKKIITALLVFGITSWAALCQAPAWSAKTSHTTQKLYGVAFSDSATAVAVGEGGTIIRSTDGGDHWALVESPVTDALRAVAFNGQTGIAVGISGRMVRSTDGGLSWTALTRITTRDLFSISMNGNMAVMTGHEGYIYRSKDGGLHWEFKNSGTFDNLFGVSVYGVHGITVGGQGAVAMTIDTARAFGLTVLGQNPLDLLSFSAVSMANDTLGWVVGYLQSSGGIVIKTGDSGFVWKKVNVDSTGALGFLLGVAALSPDFCTIVGSGGKIYNTTDHGRSWSEQPTGITRALNAVAFENKSLGIAVGDSGTVLKLGQVAITGVPDINSTGNAGRNMLDQIYPNPFRGITTLTFNISTPAFTTLKIFSSGGEMVTTLVSGELPAGKYSAGWSADGMASGVYYCQLTSGKYVETKKMIVLK
jgi:photosystem II stability/assembly factor-like uncharacterized protein